MLQDIRDNSRGIIAYILIGILVLFFAISGMEVLFNWNVNADQAAKVNGHKITKMELQRAIENQKQQILSRYGNQVPAEFISDGYLKKPVLDNLIRRQVLVQVAENSGLAVSQSIINEQIKSEPGFKNEKGDFDNKKYQQLLGMMGLSHTAYTKLLAEDQVLNQLQTAVSNSAFILPYEMDDVVALSFQSRDLSYFQIPVEQVRDSIAINEEEIAAEYSANPESYTAPEEVAVDYIELRSSDLMKYITITEEQLHKQYEQNVATFVAKPERQVAHILIEGDKPELVKEIADKIAAGDDFATLAKSYSEDLGTKENGGDLGFTDGTTFPKEFEAVLSALQIGQVSAPTKTDAGTHFIKLLAERGGKAPSFDEQRTSIEDQLKLAEAENLFVAKLERLKEDTYNAEKLADVAPGLELAVKNTGLFSRTSGKEIATNPKFVEAAFSDEVLQEGNASEPVELEPSYVVVMKKTEHSPSHLKSIAEVREQIVNLLKDKKAREMLAQKGQNYIDQLQKGEILADVAKLAGYPVKEIKAATRGSADMDVEVLRHAFSMAKPTAEKSSVSGITLANGDYVVVVVNAVNAGNKNKLPAEQQKAIVTQLNNMAGQKNFESFQKALEDRAEIVRSD